MFFKTKPRKFGNTKISHYTVTENWWRFHEDQCEIFTKCLILYTSLFLMSRSYRQSHLNCHCETEVIIMHNNLIHKSICSLQGSNMIFYALTSAGPLSGFNTSQGAQQMLVYQKSMFDRYYCIKLFFSLENFGEIAQKVIFTCTYNGTEKLCFENVASRAKTNFITTVHFTDDEPGVVARSACKQPRVRSPRPAHSFVETWSWKHFYGHSPSSADPRRAVVSYWRKNVH